MNILVPNNWLKDYIKTNAQPAEIADALSLHAFSVEKIIKQAGDDVFEIEVTPNRGDALSVLGIARELRAILPRQKFEAVWQEPKIEQGQAGSDCDLKVEIKDKSLVPRFSAIVLDNIQIKESPDFIKERLAQVGSRPLNNVIDITNYLMFDKGQPMHAFDYDKILGGKMIVRESKKGEKLITLDGVERELPAGVIVIEDGEGRLIDLCGIMGAKNSEVDENTKRVLLFVQVYDPVRIRKSSMALGHRTEAALRFEKGIDFDGVIPALWEAVAFLKKYASAKESSGLIDILNIEQPAKKVALDYERINLVAGVAIEREAIDKILADLGFKKEGSAVVVPSWRYDDIDIAEDLAEEVIRLYGYYNLPNKILTGDIPEQTPEPVFYWEGAAKNYLKHQGFFECYTNSATNEQLDGQGALKIVNPLTEEFKYLKTSLLPQLKAVMEKNQSFGETIKIFELASVYISRNHDIPEQPLRLGLMSKGVDYLEFKGAIEGLIAELGISGQFDFVIQELPGNMLAAELDFEALVAKASQNKVYTPLSSFNSIKEDLTLVVPENTSYAQIEELVLATNKRIVKLAFKDIYKNFLTLAIEYLDREQQISSVETQEIRERIFKELENKLNVRLKT